MVVVFVCASSGGLTCFCCFTPSFHEEQGPVGYFGKTVGAEKGTGVQRNLYTGGVEKHRGNRRVEPAERACLCRCAGRLVGRMYVIRVFLPTHTHTHTSHSLSSTHTHAQTAKPGVPGAETGLWPAMNLMCTYFHPPAPLSAATNELAQVRLFTCSCAENSPLPSVSKNATGFPGISGTPRRGLSASLDAAACTMD